MLNVQNPPARFFIEAALFKSAGEALTGLRQNYFQNKSF
jgi:hypothetical protein